MCSSTGTGIAKNRAFSGVTFVASVSCTSRPVPAMAGTRLSTMSDAGISQSRLVEVMSVILVRCGARYRRSADARRVRRSDAITTRSFPVPLAPTVELRRIPLA